MKWIEDLEVPPYRPLMGGRFLHPTGVTVLFGHGGQGKGYIAAALTHRLAYEGTRVGVLDFEQHPEEWKTRLASAPREMVAYEEFDEDIAVSRHRITEYVGDFSLGYIVVDSVARSVPEPLKGQTDSAVARRMFSILHDLGVPALIIAHVPKGAMKDEGAQHVANPVGSVQYTNQARLTWSVVQTASVGGTFTCETKCMKVNDRPRPDVRTWEFNPEAGTCQVFQRGADVFNVSRVIWQKLNGDGKARTAAALSIELRADYPMHESSLTRVQIERILYRRRGELFGKVAKGWVALSGIRLLDKWGDGDDDDGGGWRIG